MPDLSISHRIRKTPFTNRVTAAGVKGYTVYNHMLLPTVFRSLEEDYHHLKSAVQIWDVSCERQVELSGPDAGRLAQAMTPRDLSKQAVGKCLYTPICDREGRLLNDPVTIRVAEDRYWISIADSDVLLFAKGLAAGMGMDVDIFEPDISPLAVQGPKADDLMAKVFGEGVRDTRFFGTQRHIFGGREHLIARSGYSGQGGFEIYLSGTDLGETLWDALMDAGEEFDVQAGCPNLIERIESGLLSYGNDFSSQHSLGETGLGRFCKIIAPDCIAANALARADAPAEQLRYITLSGDPMTPLSSKISLSAGGLAAGEITSAVWSPDYDTNVGIGMIRTDCLSATTRLLTNDEDARDVSILNGPISQVWQKAA